ncbi:PH domain-containing protein [Membranihabitans marinus]|uniref:PH domain-containing protein n=1 Tax=Membranihabitans marinus TaxID=1227546 RepID=UPI001F265CC1|nr:PH domain-containing protein [Membranihabitans marinus]
MEAIKWTRLASPAVVVKVIAALRSYALLAVYFFYRAFNRMEDESIWGNINLLFDFLLNVFPAFLIVLVGVMEYRKFKYALSPENLRIEQGWLRKEKKMIPIDKIQSVQIEQNLLYRYLNIYMVKIDTIGEKEVEVEIGGVLKEEALDIKSQVQQYKTSIDVEEDEEEVDIEDEIPYALDHQQVMRYGITENILWVLTPLTLASILIYRLFDASDLENVNIGMVFKIIFGEIDELGINGGRDQYISYLLLYGLVFGTFSSAMVLINRITGLFNFKLFLRSTEIFIQRGLINKFEVIIPHRKVQYVTWYTNLIRKKLGIYTFNFKFSGHRRTLGADAIIPFFNEDQVDTFLEPYLMYQGKALDLAHRSPYFIEEKAEVSEEDEGLESEEKTDIATDGFRGLSRLMEVAEDKVLEFGISKAYVIRNFILAKLPVAALLIAIAYYIHPYLFYVAFLLPIYFFIHNMIFVKNYKLYFYKDELMIKKGVWGLRTIVLKWEKIQKVSFRQSPYQQRNQLVNLTLGTASSHIAIPYMDLALAEAVKDYGLYKTEISKRQLF